MLAAMGPVKALTGVGDEDIVAVGVDHQSGPRLVDKSGIYKWAVGAEWVPH